MSIVTRFPLVKDVFHHLEVAGEAEIKAYKAWVAEMKEYNCPADRGDFFIDVCADRVFLIHRNVGAFLMTSKVMLLNHWPEAYHSWFGES